MITLAAQPATANEGEIADEKSTRSTDEKKLKDAGTDAHSVKEEIVGKKNISQYDLRVDRITGELVVFRKGAKTGVRTDEFLRPPNAKPLWGKD